MATTILFLLSFALFAPFSSLTAEAMSKGASLSVENPEVLISPNGVFSAGFYCVGFHAFCWLLLCRKLPSHVDSHTNTIVWVANRDQPVNGKRSKLSLLKNGNLILTDAGKFTVWATNTFSLSFVQLFLFNTGNLVLRNTEGVILWESFDFPTDTLLPHQLLTRNTKLVSSRSQTNYSSGFYELFFDNDNLLRLLFNGPDVSSTYWPDPWLVSWEAGRTSYNNSRIAVFNSMGNFSSSDDLTFKSADYGAVLHRRLTLGYDGNLRLYSWEEEKRTWVVSWQAIQKPCTIHGACGANSLCNYVNGSNRKCSCLPGYKMKNRTDWGYGCEPEFDLSCNKNESILQLVSTVEFYGYDFGFFPNYTFDQCTNLCLEACNCRAFQYTYHEDTGSSNCYPKTLLLNGYRSSDFKGDIYLKLPKSKYNSYVNHAEEFSLVCSNEGTIKLARIYVKNRENGTVKFMLWFACGVGGLEVLCIFVVCCLLIRTRKSSGADKQGYIIAATGFKKFTYAELKRATKGFTEEIGRGAWGAVYKGMVTGKGPTRSAHDINEGVEIEHERLVTWVREKKNGEVANWIKDIIDPTMVARCDMGKMEILVEMALQCVAEDKDARPTMSQVVEMLLHHENDHH
ncbi:putative receptor protein kinase zmpk1 [Quercus suber]|uniref:Receptor protein kinase zmpk1 n=1 Tax=Quercus suber TaxID=58331 RepID=A0AAW0L711_QUESU